MKPAGWVARCLVWLIFSARRYRRRDELASCEFAWPSNTWRSSARSSASLADEYRRPPCRPSRSSPFYIRYFYEVEKIINLTSRRRAVTITACVFAPLSSSALSAGLSAGSPRVPASDDAELQVGNRGRHSKPGDGPFAFSAAGYVVRRAQGTRSACESRTRGSRAHSAKPP